MKYYILNIYVELNNTIEEVPTSSKKRSPSYECAIINEDESDVESDVDNEDSSSSYSLEHDYEYSERYKGIRIKPFMSSDDDEYVEQLEKANWFSYYD